MSRTNESPSDTTTALFLLFGKKKNNKSCSKPDYVDFLKTISDNKEDFLYTKSVKDLKKLIIAYARDKNIFKELNQERIKELCDLKAENDIFINSNLNVDVDSFNKISDSEIKACLESISDAFDAGVPSVDILKTIRFPKTYSDFFDKTTYSNVFGNKRKVSYNVDRRIFYPYIYYFIYLCATQKPGLAKDFSLDVIEKDDTQINFAEMNEIFNSNLSVPDSRQLLAIQRFTKYRDQNDKASFMFHGVGTGKTITSLLICLSNLKPENKRSFDGKDSETKPFKILIIAPEGLFFTSFLGDAQKLGIYVHNTSRVDVANGTSIETCTGYYVKDHGFELVDGKNKINSAYQIEFTSYDYKALAENGFDPLDDYDVLICDEAHRLLTTKLKPLGNNDVEKYKKIEILPKVDIVGDNGIEFPIKYKYITYRIPYQDEISSKKNELGLQWVREQVILGQQQTTKSVEEPIIIRDYRLLEFIVKKIKIQSIFLTGTPFQTDTLDISHIAMFLNHPAINQSNNADFMKFYIQMGRVKIFNVKDVYDVSTSWKVRPGANLVKALGQVTDAAKGLQIPSIMTGGDAPAPLDELPPLPPHSTAEKGNDSKVAPPPLPYHLPGYKPSPLDTLPPLPPHSTAEKGNDSKVAPPKLVSYNLGSFYERFPLVEMNTDDDKLTYYGNYHGDVEKYFLIPNALQIIKNTELNDFGKAQEIVKLFVLASDGYFKIFDETKSPNTVTGRTYDADKDAVKGGDQKGGTWTLILSFIPFIQFFGFSAMGAFAGLRTDAKIVSFITTTLQLYVSKSKTFSEKMFELGPTYVFGPIMGTTTSGIGGLMNLMLVNGYTYTLFIGIASIFLLMILAINTVDYEKKLTEDTQYKFTFFVRFWYRAFLFIRSTTHTLEQTGSDKIYKSVMTATTAVGNLITFQSAMILLKDAIVSTAEDVKTSGSPAVDALLIYPTNCMLYIPYIICNTIFDLIPPVNVADAITFTKPYCSVYNYEYNRFAINDNEFQIEILKQTVKAPVNTNGNKNRFPRQYVEQYLVPFTNEQTDLLNEDPIPNFDNENNIGCGLLVDFEKKTKDEIVDYAKETMTYVNKQIEFYIKNKIYNDGIQINEMVVEKRTPFNIVNNNTVKNNAILTEVLRKVNELKAGFKADELKKKFIPVSQDNSTQNYRFQHMLLLLQIIRCGSIFKNGEFLLQPHYVKNSDSYEYFLPIIYPSTVRQMWGVCNFLKENGERFLLQNVTVDISIQNIFKAGQILTFPISSETNTNPLCIIISPEHMEGFSYVYNPAIFEIGLCNTYGDEKQVDGRIYRKYPKEYSKNNDERFDKIVYRYFGGSLYDIENFSQLVTLYQTDELQKIRYGYNLIEQFLETGSSTPEGFVSSSVGSIGYETARVVTRPFTLAKTTLKPSQPLLEIARDVHGELGVGATLSVKENTASEYVTDSQKAIILKSLQRKAYNEEVHLKQIQTVKGICANYFNGFLDNENKQIIEDRRIKVMPLDLSLLRFTDKVDDKYVTEYYKPRTIPDTREQLILDNPDIMSLFKDSRTDFSYSDMRKIYKDRVDSYNNKKHIEVSKKKDVKNKYVLALSYDFKHSLERTFAFTPISELIKTTTKIFPDKNYIMGRTEQLKSYFAKGGKSKRKRSLFRFKKTQHNKPKKQKATRKKHNKRKKVHVRTIKKVKM